jgi:hypothetical protein
MANDNTGRRGFANMDEDEQRETAKTDSVINLAAYAAKRKGVKHHGN